MKRLFLQITKFIGLSGIGWILDFTVYMLLGMVSDNLTLSNMVSSWVGVTFVFTLATRKVFENTGKIPLWCKYIIYLVYQAILIYFVSKLLNVVNETLVNIFVSGLITKFSAIISKIVITPVTMILNFLVMKGIVEYDRTC